MSPAPVDKTKDFLLSERFSDMKITCQGQTFKVHRFIICRQSPFFEIALSGPFKESTENTVDLLDDNPETIERVVSYLYMNEYREDGHVVPLDGRSDSETQQEQEQPENGKNGQVDTTRAIGSNHVQVYIAADKFGIANLKTLARDKFADWANANWKSSAFIEIVQEVISSVSPHDSVFGMWLEMLYRSMLLLLCGRGDSSAFGGFWKYWIWGY